MVGKKKGANLAETKVKEKQLRDINAPKIPRNAYQRFVAHRLKVSPSKKFGTSREAMANFAAEWMAMDPQMKQPYFDEYIAERDEYSKKMEEYKKTTDYKAFQLQKAVNRRKSEKVTSTDHLTPPHLPPGVKQIFTSEFLEYNKNQEKRVRDVRMQINEVESQIGLLDRHIASLNGQMHAMQSAASADEAIVVQMGDKMQRWCAIVRDALGMGSDASLEAVIERTEQLADERNTGVAEAQRAQAAIQQAMRRAEEGDEKMTNGRQCDK